MSTRILAATRKGLFLLERDGASPNPWRISDTRFLGDNVSTVLCDPRDNRVHVALDHGHFGVKMHRAVEWSAPFEECPAPAYPEKPPGEPERDQWGKEIPWTTVRVWALEPGGPDEPRALWCGTLPGGLFRSEDSGASWQLVRPLWDHPLRKEWFGGGADLPGIHSICVDPRQSAVVRIGVSCAGVWTTRDRGASWSCEGKGMWAAYMPPERKFEMNVQDPHRVVQCPAAPDRLWAQHHNGIFRSSDAGLTWEDIEGTPTSAFGFPVAVHPRDPDTAWFVPAIKDEQRIPAAGRVVVTRTRDGGRSFAELTRGLPQQHAYDLVYRHALDVSPSGDELAFGSTTGGLWTSGDQGDTWHALEARLPPVYAVRFMP